jgi:AcrR family transcriptional regulator
MMNKKESSIREKIILAVVECIEKEGFQSVTTRSIAKEAGVNIAAINYYFGSKENLLKLALNERIIHSREDFDQIKNTRELDPAARIRTFLRYLFEGTINYPGFTKAVLSEPLQHNQYDEVIIQHFEYFMAEILTQLKLLRPVEPEEKLRLLVVQTISAILFSALLPGVFTEFIGREPKGAKFIDDYIDLFMERLLPQPK